MPQVKSYQKNPSHAAVRSSLHTGDVRVGYANPSIRWNHKADNPRLGALASQAPSKYSLASMLDWAKRTKPALWHEYYQADVALYHALGHPKGNAVNDAAKALSALAVRIETEYSQHLQSN